MPLLKAGQPFTLPETIAANYNQKMIWHVPPRPFDQENHRHGIGAGMSIPNKYLMKEGNNMVEVRYYTDKRWDDGLKKDFYIVENTAESIEFDAKGIITTQNAELNYFLDNCPWNRNNKYRIDPASGSEVNPENNPYRNVSVLFWQHNPKDSYKVAGKKARAIAKIQAYIDIESPHRWNEQDVIHGCQVILAHQVGQIPNAIANYQEYKDEKDVPTLRLAIMELVMRDPLTTMELLVDRRESHIMRMINECLKYSEISGFNYNQTERKYTYRKRDGNIEEILKIDQRKNPEQHMLTEALENSKVFNKLWNIWDKMNKELAAGAK